MLELNIPNLVRMATSHIKTSVNELNKYVESHFIFSAVLWELNVISLIKREILTSNYSENQTANLEKLEGSLRRLYVIPMPSLTSTSFSQPELDVLFLG